MFRTLMGVGIALIFAMTPTRGIAQGVEGTWKLSYIVGGTNEGAIGLLKLKTQDGKLGGETVPLGAAFPKLMVNSITLKEKVLSLDLRMGTINVVFETGELADAAKRLPGTLSINGTLYPAVLTATEEAEPNPKNGFRPLDCPPMQEARSLTIKAGSLRLSAQQTKDPDKKKELLRQAIEADQMAKRLTPALYREVLSKHADSPAVFEAVVSLIRSAQANKSTPEEVKGWATAADNAAKAYGPRWQADIALQVASALLTQGELAKLAVGYARQAERSLSPTTSTAGQIRVLGVLVQALKKAGQDDEAKPFDAKLDKLEGQLDREYLSKMPPFKGAPFTGRKANSDRAVFMELFTGATCPPCVAADLAFDVLTKTYKPSELVLIQYHVHIPGPDPMTNPDTVARWDYYRKAFPKLVGGVPSSLFNGKPEARGGGPIAGAEKKYEAYREVIDPLLEKPASAKITASARLKGDSIEIQVGVTDLTDPTPQKKLRILLAEETIRYAGSNGIRFHHNVVRAFPGGVAGQALTEAASKHKASINLVELRGQLTKYLDDYQENVRPFANSSRPLAFNQLRVIAFVQDDESNEILQAVQVEVEGK